MSDYRRRRMDEAIDMQSGTDPETARRRAMEDSEAAEAERRRKMAEALRKRGGDPNSPMSMMRRMLGLDP